MAESLNINDFKGFFTSGARPNLYKVRIEKYQTSCIRVKWINNIKIHI